MDRDLYVLLCSQILFDYLIELPDDARLSTLVRVAPDPEVRALVGRLLFAHDQFGLLDIPFPPGTT